MRQLPRVRSLAVVDWALGLTLVAVLAAAIAPRWNSDVASLGEAGEQVSSLRQRQRLVEGVAHNMTVTLNELLAELEAVEALAKDAEAAKVKHNDDAWVEEAGRIAREVSASFRSSVADVVSMVEAARTELLALPIK